MGRLKASFLGLVAVAALLGGYTAVDLGGSLRTADDVSRIRPQVSGEALGADLGDDRLSVRIRVSNPTRFDLTLDSGALRVFNRSDARIVGGAGTRVDGGPTTVPARGSLVVTYEVRVNDAQRRELALALRGEAFVSATLGLTHDGRSFTAPVTDMPIQGGGA